MDSAKRPFGETSIRRNVHSVKRPFGETSIRRNGFGEMGFGETAFGETYRNRPIYLENDEDDEDDDLPKLYFRDLTPKLYELCGYCKKGSHNVWDVLNLMIPLVLISERTI